MLFRIIHRTRFEYEQPAHDSHNELRLRPLEMPEQRCVAFELSIDQPAAVLAYHDFFGNQAHSISVSAPHRELTIVARSLVDRSETLAQNTCRNDVTRFPRRDDAHIRDYCEFLNPSHYIPFSERLQKFFWMARPARPRTSALYVTRIVA